MRRDQQASPKSNRAEAPAIRRARILEAARSLVPALRARADAATTARNVPAESIADFERLGLFRIGQPARFGGDELGWDVMCEVSEMLAAADGSQAWIQGIMANHAHMLGTFPIEAQKEVWEADPRARIAAAFDPKGIARRDGGDLVLSGEYSYASGIDHAQWLICGGFIEDGGRRSGPHFFLVPADAAEVIDDWFAIGLEGTGSKSFGLRDVRLPLHRMLDGEQARIGRGAGTLANANIIYRIPRGGVTAAGFAAMCTGIARGVLEDWLALDSTRRNRAGGTWQDAGNLVALAEATAKIDAGHDLYTGTIRRTMDKLAAGDQPDDLDLLTARRNMSYATRLANEAGTLLFRAAGGGAIRSEQRIGQQYRNLMAASAHFAVAWDVHGPAYAQHLVARRP